MTLELRNPHSVKAVLERRPLDVLEVQVAADGRSEAWEEVVRLAARCGVTVLRAEGRRRGRRVNKSAEAGRQGTAFARVKERKPVPLEQLFVGVEEENERSGTGTPAVWLALDCLQDPHNVGAIFRTAAFFGVRGIVVTRDRSAPLNQTVYDVASGGVEYVPFALEVNLARTLRKVKEAGVWVLGTSEHAESEIATVKPDRPWLIVVGNEERGLRRLTLEQCDVVCRLPARGAICSLNVSVATAVTLSWLFLR